MGGSSLPPGFRFHPTDEELVGYYLKRKVQGLEIELEVIPVIDLYKFDPWELPEKSFLPKRDMEWFFFCPRDRKYPNGSRTNRATNAGYWKATGKDRKVLCQNSFTGYRKTLVFYRGRAPLGDRTDWVMHEYRLSDDVSQTTPNFQGPFALCRVMKRNEQKTSYVDSESKDKGVESSSKIGNLTSTVIIRHDSESNHSSPLMSPYQKTPMFDNEQNSSIRLCNSPSFWVSPDLILDSSKELSQGVQEGEFGNFPQNETRNSMNPWQPFEQFEISPSSSYSNFTEEFEPADDPSRFGCIMSPYSENGSFTGFFGNEDHTLYWTNSLDNQNPF